MGRMLVYAPDYRLKTRRSLSIIRAKWNFRLFLSVRFLLMRQVVPGEKDFARDDRHTPSLRLFASPSLYNNHMRCPASSDFTATPPIS